MAMLNVRLPKKLERALPRKQREERIKSIAQSAADHAEEELELLREWEPATAPIRPSRSRKAKR